jgi:energy-converting hydrogenase Eha subunit B
MFHPASKSNPSPAPWILKSLGLLSIGLIALFGFLSACGGGDSSTTPPSSQATVVQVNLGDAPADWVLAFSTTINSLTVHGSDGSTAIVSSPVPVELTRNMGTLEPIALGLANQGTYTSATVTFGDAHVTYIDPSTHTVQQKTITGPFSADVPFGSGVTLGTTPLAFNFDLDLNYSLSLNNSNQFAFSPTFHFSFGQQGGGNGSGGMSNGMGPFFGGMQHMFGVVSSTGNGYIVMTSLQAMNTFTIQVNSQTQYRGLATSLSQLTAGMGIWVSAALQSDGTLLASRINAMMRSGGIMGGGIVVAVDGPPATQLTIVMQNGAGASVNTAYLSKTLTVNLTADTTYSIDDDRVDLSNLPFTPLFDQNHIYLGQSVLPVDDSGNIVSGDTTSAGTITASSLSLQERGFRGTTDTNLTAGTAATFTLTLPADCAFTTLTGATTITVYQQAATNLQYQTDIAAGSTIRVHGLLFNNQGQWVMVASTIASTTSTT